MNLWFKYIKEKHRSTHNLDMCAKYGFLQFLWDIKVTKSKYHDKWCYAWVSKHRPDSKLPIIEEK